MSESMLKPLGKDGGREGAKRRAPRTRLLNVRADSPSLEFELLELSPIGMSIETSKRLEVGSKFPIRLRHKDGTVELEGEVRWCRLHLTSVATRLLPARYRAGLALRGEGLTKAERPEVDRVEERTQADPRRESVYDWSLRAAPVRPVSRPRVQAPPYVEPESEEGRSTEESKIEAIREILEKKSLHVVFQPIYNLKEGNVFGYEALARCPVPALRNLPELYRVAALAGLVGELGRQHRTQAVEQAPQRPLFINVNPHEFDYGWLVQPDDPIFRHDHPVYVEVTENVPVARFEQCLSVLRELRGKGIQVAIDDLGSGFSNLRYLVDLAPDFVKIDRSLIAGVRDSTRQFRLLESIVRMCKSLGSRVIAEGIEHTEELVAVDHAGVDFCQGYLLGRPELPAQEGSWPAFR